MKRAREEERRLLFYTIVPQALRSLPRTARSLPNRLSKIAKSCTLRSSTRSSRNADAKVAVRWKFVVEMHITLLTLSLHALQTLPGTCAVRKETSDAALLSYLPSVQDLLSEWHTRWPISKATFCVTTYCSFLQLLHARFGLFLGNSARPGSTV